VIVASSQACSPGGGHYPLLLAVFNVIPAAPLDGGRLLQAVLWAITKDKLKAAMGAARSGQVFGWALIVVGGYLVLARRDYSWLWFVILGWFLTSAATAENQQAVVQSRLRTVAVREIMTADPVTEPASATVTRFQHDLLPWLRHSAFPVVDDDGQTVGLATVRRVNAVPADERDRTTLREVACPRTAAVRRRTAAVQVGEATCPSCSSFSCSSCSSWPRGSPRS
jgi:hypothetical protein